MLHMHTSRCRWPAMHATLSSDGALPRCVISMLLTSRLADWQKSHVECGCETAKVQHWAIGAANQVGMCCEAQSSRPTSSTLSTVE